MREPCVLESVDLEPLPDDELAALSLAADPDAPISDDAVCLWDMTGPDAARLLPDWYMPAATGGAAPLRGWRRRVVLLVIVTFVVINAYGLCSTYGWVGYG